MNIRDDRQIKPGAGRLMAAAFLALWLTAPPVQAADDNKTDPAQPAARTALKMDTAEPDLKRRPGKPAGALNPQSGSLPGQRKVSVLLRETPLSEAMAMLAESEKVNILLGKDVTGEVNVNLHNVSLDEAVRTMANAAGYAVEYRNGAYLVFKREEVGKYSSGLTQLRTFKIQYSKAESLEPIVKNHLSAYGKVTKLAERKLLVVEDQPEFLDRIAALLRELDRQPRQILIEAKILEVTLDDNQSFGMDWKKMLDIGNDSFSIGVAGLSKPSSGLDFHLVNPNNADLVLKALKERNLVRTLSTPRLLALEDQQAQTVIGDRQGYRVTTTINQVTTENIQFLESGVILKVTPSVDDLNRILLAIHPEVSRGNVDNNGIPSQKTTEVTTNMLVEDGQTVLIAGLIKQQLDQTRDGVPGLGDIPLIGRLFSNEGKKISNTETIVLITPRLVADSRDLYDNKTKSRTESAEQELREVAGASEAGVRLLFDRGY